MYKILDKTSDSVLVKMDITTFEAIQSDLQEEINNYDFTFNEPIKASKLIEL